MKVFLAWSTFKEQVSNKGRVRYNDDGDYYSIEYYDAIGEFQTTILKSETTDIDDFEDNYVPLANKEVKVPNQISLDGRQISAVNRIPSGFTVYPTGAADHIANGTYGNGTNLKFDAGNATRRFQLLGHWYGIGGRAIWESASLDDYIDAKLVAPASTGLTDATGDFDKVNIGGPYNLIKPVATGTGDWTIDLTAKLTNTQILKCTPVPSSGNLGWFDYNSDTNVLTPNMDQEGGYNLYDFEVTLFKFCNKAWGRKQDGAESVLEASDVVGKLLFNSWVIEFALTAVTEGVKCGIIMNTAVKQNV